MNRMKHLFCVSGLALWSAVAGAGEMSIDAVIVDSTDGRTFSAACQNVKGYFTELGPRTSEARLLIDGKWSNEPLRSIFRRSVPPGWHLEFGKALPSALAIDWSAPASWVDVLAVLARQNHLVVFIVWA